MSLLSIDWGDDDEDSSDFVGGMVGLLDFVGGRVGSLTQVQNGSIYFFRCEGEFYKVGMTKRDVEQRLKEHRGNPDPMLRPRRDTLIKVFACDDVRQAETSILRDENTASCRVSGMEYFREDIGDVIERVVKQVNSRPLVISYYTLNARNEIVRVR